MRVTEKSALLRLLILLGMLKHNSFFALVLLKVKTFRDARLLLFVFAPLSVSLGTTSAQSEPLWFLKLLQIDAATHSWSHKWSRQCGTLIFINRVWLLLPVIHN